MRSLALSLSLSLALSLAHAQAPSVIASVPDMTVGNDRAQSITLSLRSTASAPQHVRVTGIAVGSRAARVVRVTQHRQPVDLVELAPGAHTALRIALRLSDATLLPRGGAIVEVRLDVDGAPVTARFRMSPLERCLGCDH